MKMCSLVCTTQLGMANLAALNPTSCRSNQLSQPLLSCAAVCCCTGLVDLLHSRHPLPHGVPHAFLSLAFGINAFLMLTHAKHEALDALVHKLLGYCMSGELAGAVAYQTGTVCSIA